MKRLLTFVALIAIVFSARAQAASEYAVKASFLYNFVVFTDWPPGDPETSTSPYNLCIVGSDNFGAVLDALQNKTIRGRPIAVLRGVQRGSLRKCHLVFVTEQEAGNMQRINAELAGAPVLTVSDSAIAEGVVISLELEDRKLKFDVDLQRARSYKLNMSSKMLSLARRLN